MKHLSGELELGGQVFSELYQRIEIRYFLGTFRNTYKGDKVQFHSVKRNLGLQRGIDAFGCVLGLFVVSVVYYDAEPAFVKVIDTRVGLGTVDDGNDTLRDKLQHIVGGIVAQYFLYLQIIGNVYHYNIYRFFVVEVHLHIVRVGVEFIDTGIEIYVRLRTIYEH